LPEPAEPEIEFRDVSFAYEDGNVLSDVSFKVAKGQMCALVGPSGSGKTTIASLLCRFWDISSGQVLVRGHDVRDVPLSDLVDQMSLVFQRVHLFQDTVHNNILLGRGTATAEEVHEAARKARCHDFITSLPYGYDTVIGEGGATLSGGEAQRVSIARCILKDAPIVVLDEATASVDPDNERAIQEAISELCRGKTLLVIAHQLSTIREAQQILVLEDGRVRQRGAHADLMAEDGRYRDMTLMQDQVISWCDPEATPTGPATPPDPSPGATPARSKIGAGAAR
jgi:ATP-binding cassette subfamily B protein